ncbi:MAG: hypothetical protein JXR53_15295 [Bacteroidales bacterium]|nr:hypothetical protein [Bacteroidales bacterium]
MEINSVNLILKQAGKMNLLFISIFVISLSSCISFFGIKGLGNSTNGQAFYRPDSIMALAIQDSLGEQEMKRLIDPILDYNSSRNNPLSRRNDTIFIPSKEYCAKIDTSQWERIYSSNYSPYTVTYEQYLSAVKLSKPVKVVNTGRLYFYRKYVFAQDLNRGIHIYTTDTLEMVIPYGFIQIPGNTDLIIKNDILFANSYDLLLVFDLRHKEFPLVAYEKGAFDPLHNTRDNLQCAKLFNDSGFILGYKYYKQTQIKCDEDLPWEKNIFTEACPEYYNPMDGIFFLNDGTSEAVSKSKGGKSGSLNRFAFGEKRLFFADHLGIQTFDVDTLSKPKKLKRQQLENFQVRNRMNVPSDSVDYEMLVYSQQRLFAGSSSLTSFIDAKNEDSIVFTSHIPHFTLPPNDFQSVRDPIIVKDSLAWITVRTEPDDVLFFSNVYSSQDSESESSQWMKAEFFRNGWSEDSIRVFEQQEFKNKQMATSSLFNTLQLVDIKDLDNPEIISTKNLRFPAGMALEDSLLFICQGDRFDLEVFKLSNRNFSSFAKLPIRCIDLIVKGDTLLGVSESGIKQYLWNSNMKIHTH